jgi:chromosome segregation ATPase
VAELLISIPVAAGDLVDKITILEIKAERTEEEAKQENIRRELALLHEQGRVLPSPDDELERLRGELKRVNERIWDLENTIRDCERAGVFDERFVETARQIYRANDERAALKRAINIHLGSAIVEEKSYSGY